VSVDRKDFGEEVGGANKARKEDKTEVRGFEYTGSYRIKEIVENPRQHC
jgi:hypothetical protein